MRLDRDWDGNQQVVFELPEEIPAQLRQMVVNEESHNEVEDLVLHNLMEILNLWEQLREGYCET